MSGGSQDHSKSLSTQSSCLYSICVATVISIYTGMGNYSAVTGSDNAFIHAGDTHDHSVTFNFSSIIPGCPKPTSPEITINLFRSVLFLLSSCKKYLSTYTCVADESEQHRIDALAAIVDLAAVLVEIEKKIDMHTSDDRQLTGAFNL